VVPEGAGAKNLQSLGVAGQSAQLWLAPPGRKPDKAPTSVSLSDQGLVQVLEAAVTGLQALPAGALDRLRVLFTVYALSGVLPIVQQLQQVRES
jgi:hypothetical protein